jgi:A/G-specific adenine glycosylase
LAVLREATEPLARASLCESWPDPVQRDRALSGLVADGLVEAREDDHFELPH